MAEKTSGISKHFGQSNLELNTFFDEQNMLLDVTVITEGYNNTRSLEKHFLSRFNNISGHNHKSLAFRGITYGLSYLYVNKLNFFGVFQDRFKKILNSFCQVYN